MRTFTDTRQKMLSDAMRPNTPAERTKATKTVTTFFEYQGIPAEALEILDMLGLAE